MIFKSKELIDKLRFVDAGTASSSTVELYKNALVELVHGKLYLRSFNLVSHSIVKLCDGYGDEADFGSMVINLNPLIDVFGQVEGDIDAEFDFKEYYVKIGAGKIRLEHACMVNSGFISSPQFNPNMVTLESPKELADLLKRTAFAVDSKSVYDFFRGVYLACNGSLEFVGTCGNILSVVNADSNQTGFHGEAIIPIESLPLVRDLIETGDNPRLAIADNHMAVVAGDYAISTTLVNSKFPNYKPLIIDEEASMQFVVDRAEVVRGLRIAERYSGEYLDAIMEFKADGTLEIRSAADQKGRSSYTMTYLGDPHEVTIKVITKNLANSINACRTDEVVLCVPNVDTPTSMGVLPSDNTTQMKVTLGLLAIN